MLSPLSQFQVFFAGLIWFLALNIPAALGASLFLVAESTPNKQMSHSQVTALIYVSIPLLVFMLLGTIWWGCTAWRNWSWKGTLASAAAGTCVIIGGYVFLWTIAFAASPSKTNQVNAAGAGVAIIMVPVFVILLVPLATGGAVAWVWDRFRRRSRSPGVSHDVPDDGPSPHNG